MGSFADDSKRLEGSPSKLVKGDAGYPQRLLDLSDPPEELHVHGRYPEVPMIAIVGSRNADPTARRFVSGLAGEIVDRGYGIVSGGALGIDTAAHRGALEAGGVSVAVIGSGFDFLYPEANRELFAELADQGAVVSEFHPSQPPTKWTFPRRNRIIAVLARAVIVAQAGERSGALITARNARELGIPVGAVPGPAGDSRHRGTHQLLRGGAGLVECASDVIDLVGTAGSRGQLELSGLEGKSEEQIEIPSNLSASEVQILDILGATPVHIDEIITGIGLGPGETSAAILALEMAGLVEDNGGKNFVKVG